MACLDKILHKQHNVSKSLRAQDQDQEQDRAEERQTLKKSLPCTGTDVLAKARCSEDSKHAGDEKGLLVKTVFPLPLTYSTDSAMCLITLVYTFGLVSLHCYH